MLFQNFRPQNFAAQVGESKFHRKTANATNLPQFWAYRVAVETLRGASALPNFSFPKISRRNLEKEGSKGKPWKRKVPTTRREWSDLTTIFGHPRRERNAAWRPCFAKISAPKIFAAQVGESKFQTQTANASNLPQSWAFRVGFETLRGADALPPFSVPKFARRNPREEGSEGKPGKKKVPTTTRTKLPDHKFRPTASRAKRSVTPLLRENFRIRCDELRIATLQRRNWSRWSSVTYQLRASVQGRLVETTEESARRKGVALWTWVTSQLWACGTCCHLWPAKCLIPEWCTLWDKPSDFKFYHCKSLQCTYIYIITKYRSFLCTYTHNHSLHIDFDIYLNPKEVLHADNFVRVQKSREATHPLVNWLKQLVKEISAEWTWGVWFTTATFFWQNWPNKVSKDIIWNTSSRPSFSDASSATGLNWPKKVGKDISFKPLRCNIDSPNGHFDKGMQALTMTEEDGQGQFCIALAPRLTQLITTDMRLFLIDLYGMQSCEIIHCGVHLARSNQAQETSQQFRTRSSTIPGSFEYLRDLEYHVRTTHDYSSMWRRPLDVDYHVRAWNEASPAPGTFQYLGYHSQYLANHFRTIPAPAFSTGVFQ